jgi:tetratricopeptide (TPR) repeat protein
LEQPDFLEAHEAMGLVHLQEKHYPQAVGEFQQVLSRDSQRVKTHHLLGVTFLAAGESTKAAAALETAVKLDPGHLNSYPPLAQAYMQHKQYQKAITWLQKGLSLDPKHQKLNYQLGMALAALNRYPEAMEAFLKSGDEAQALNNIGVHYFMAGRYEEAAKCFQKAIDSRPHYYEEAKINLHRAMEKLQQHASNASD